MKLWKLEQKQHCGYDTFDSVIVAAPDVDTAKGIHPNGCQDWPPASKYNAWCDSPDMVKITYLGKAAKGIAQGIILVSFNAG